MNHQFDLNLSIAFKAIGCGRLRLLVIAASLSLLPATSIAEPKTAVADNGREVILKENGEWEYVSEDVFATTPDGQRIRLQPNQQWREVSDSQAPVYQPVAITTVQSDLVRKSQAQLGEGNITLDQIHIENQRETIGKNKRVRSNLVFYIEVSDTALLSDMSNIPAQNLLVQDSRGKEYPVFSVVEGVAPIGSQPRLIVRAKGAPRWWGVKFFSIQIGKGALGNAELIELRKPMQDVMRKEVSELPEDNL